MVREITVTNNQTNSAEQRPKNSEAELLQNWQHITEQIVQASQAHQPVTLIAVSKTKPASRIAELAQAGQRDFGENYLQEAMEKIAELEDHADCENIVWHYIGSIQRNKTRDIAENFDWVQTVERGIIAKRLNNQRPDDLPNLNVLIQVNIDAEDSKSGCAVDELNDLVDEVKGYERLTLRGLMILPAKDDNTEAFARTKALFDDIKIKHPELEQWDTLSMGMSGDMVQAIQNGSTMVRVGSAIFGARE